jgi:hypothetical protein
MTPTGVTYRHLRRLSDGTGLFEHALLTEPRIDHGYCVDDVARGLVVIARDTHPDEETSDLSATYLRFLVAAQAPDGRFHNRRDAFGRWRDEPGLDDCWGRALWGLGTAAGRSGTQAATALEHFDISARRRSPHTRAMAFAALGAAEVLRVMPQHREARRLLRDGAAVIGSPGRSPAWRWPEPRLRYANAVLPETLLLAGSLLNEPRWLDDGLTMLRWLLDVETNGDHISVTPVDGWGPGEERPGFDQQPIEVAALADACAVAFDITGDRTWRDALESCAAWFAGVNDVGIVMFDAIDGAGYDGLERGSRNENRGAESTLAMLSTFQQTARMLVATP